MKSQYFADTSRVVVALVCLSFAQGEALAAPAEAEISDADIIVTAQRRQERLQDVPIAITVADSAALERASIENISDVPQIAPGLVVTAGVGAMNLFLRGVGNPSNIAGNEASVSAYVDGVYYTRLSPALFDLNNVERIEVLKGPQGTLFGRNSTGGLVHVITKKPSFDSSVEMQLGYGNYDTVSASSYMTGGLSESVAVALSVNYRDQNKGWGENVVTGEDVRLSRSLLLRGNILMNLGPATEVLLTGDYIDSTADQATIAGQPYRGTTSGTPLGLPPVKYKELSNFYDYNQNYPVGEDSKIHGLSAKVTHEFPWASLVSISAYRHSEVAVSSDVDMSPIAYSNAIQLNKNESFSQELQLLSSGNDPLSWVLGLYYLNSKEAYPANYVWGAQFGGNGIAFVSQQTVNSYAGYAQATYDFTPATSFTAGIRYTHDNISGSGRTDGVAPTSAAAHPDFDITATGATTSASTSFKKLTWRLGLDHKLSDDVMLYGTVSTGFKAGLYNLLPFTPTALKPETMTAYEVGLKSMLFDRRLRLNISGFWYDQSNVQVQQAIATGGVITVFSTNAAKARSRGFDIEGEWRVTPDLTANFGLSYVDAEYLDFPGAPSTVNNDRLVPGIDSLGNPAMFVPGCTVPAAGNVNPANGGNVNTCPVDASGNRVVRSPEVTASFGLNYHVPVGEGGLDISGNVAYNDGFYWLADNQLRQDAYTLLSASVKYTFPGERFSIRVWGRNLGGEKYYATMSQFAGPSGSITAPAAPRTYGIQLSAKF